MGRHYGATGGALSCRRQEPFADAALREPEERERADGGEQNERRQRIMALKQELVGGDLLTAAEVAEILDIHPRTVGEYIKEGKLRAFQLGGGWKISEGALRAFVREQTQAPPGRPRHLCRPPRRRRRTPSPGP